jgi:hypothetical protein
MKGKIIKDWSKVDLRNPEHVKKWAAAFQHFMRVPDKNVQLKAAMQQFTTKGDFPDEILQVLEKFHATNDWDTGFEQIFDIRDFTGTNQSGFDILDVSSGLTFAKIPVGDKIKIYKMEGAKTSVTFDRYGGGLNWDRMWFDDRQYWQIEDTAIEFRNKAYNERASNFYALIDAISSGQNLTWQGSSSDTQVSRDVQTMNKAALNILTDLKDSGYGVTPQSGLVILAPLALKPRIEAALANLNQATANSIRSVSYTFRPVYSLMLSSTTVYYVAVPKIKAKAGYRMDLTLFNLFDPLAYADTVAGWMRYGGAIGDVDQFQRCATS